MNKNRIVAVAVILLLIYAGGVWFRNAFLPWVPVPLLRIPSYLSGVYEQGLYKTEIRVYRTSLTFAPDVYVLKTIASPFPGRRMYMADSSCPFLGCGPRRFEAFLKKLKPHESGVAGKEYQYARYRVTSFADKRPLKDYDLVVIRHRGRVLFRWIEPAVGDRNYGKPDIRRLPDGRYMAVNGHAVRYISGKRGKKVIECYFDTGAPVDVGSFHTGPVISRHGMPDITILTDNVIRLAYKDGIVEHRKVRLSREDFLKNAGLSNDSFDDKDAYQHRTAGNAHVLWRSCAPDPLDRPRKMWCYREGGKEPSASAYADISFAKTK